MNWQDIAVGIIGVAICAIVVARIVRRVRNPRYDTQSCEGCPHGCPLYDDCRKPEKR